MMAATSLRKQHQFDALQGADANYTNFPDTFNDFFSKISEGDDDTDDVVVTMLEDKLIPRANTSESDKSYQRKTQARRNGLHRRSFHRLSQQPPGAMSLEAAVSGASPAVTRRRSSSIAVARPPPDLHRFLMAEQQRPWGQHPPPSPSPSPRARHTPPISEQRYRSRTSSMPAVPRHRPMLGQLRRPGIGGNEDLEYYRVRSFSITPNGIFNLGDSFRSRRSHSITSVSSTGSSRSEESLGQRERLLSSVSQCSASGCETPDVVPKFKVAMLGASGVGKTALTCQFTTSEYICAYDTSLDEEFGQKTVSVMLDGREAELEIVDHPASEMSVESYCATYNPDVFVVVYSVVERKSLKVAEDILLFLWKGDYVASRGVILVGNKADLERKREVPMAVGRKLANSCGCKFIETSSGLDHNVDELLVGILAQVQLNPRRDRDRLRRDKKQKVLRIGSGRRILRHLLGIKHKSRSCENLLIL